MRNITKAELNKVYEVYLDTLYTIGEHDEDCIKDILFNLICDTKAGYYAEKEFIDWYKDNYTYKYLDLAKSPSFDETVFMITYMSIEDVLYDLLYYGYEYKVVEELFENIDWFFDEYVEGQEEV